MLALNVHHLDFDYSDTPVLRDVSFGVKPGMICGLLGPNGSGKTTLFKCLNGLLTPAKGHVSIEGNRVAGMSRKTVAGLMAVVPQQSDVAFSFTVLQMVLMARAARLSMWQRPSREDEARARCVLATLGMEDLCHKRFNELSGGEKQMVLLARALFQAPEVLLLDEPTAHLDFKNQHLVLDTVRQVTRRQGLTTIVSLHDPNLAARYCDVIVMLKGGQVYGCGTATDLFDAAVIEAVYGIKVVVTGHTPGDFQVAPQMNQMDHSTMQAYGTVASA